MTDYELLDMVLNMEIKTFKMQKNLEIINHDQKHLKETEKEFVPMAMAGWHLSHEMELIQADLFKRHSDYHIVVEEIGMKLHFIWAPYITNLTHFGTG
ncbi:hypothetical protein LXL04_023284 [Taraxacum kok-saghyz]